MAQSPPDDAGGEKKNEVDAEMKVPDEVNDDTEEDTPESNENQSTEKPIVTSSPVRNLANRRPITITVT